MKLLARVRQRWLRRLRRWAALALIPVSVTACSQNYTAERMFWKAQQTHADVLKDPAKASDDKLAAAVHDFQQIVEKVPGTMWAGRAQLAVGTLQLSHKQFDAARDSFGRVLQNYNRHGDLALRARVAIAKSHEAEDHWKNAVEIYKEISEYHPWSQIGLEAPLYIAANYEKRKNSAEATTAYERAVRIYSRMIPDAPSPSLSMQVKGYLTLAYQRLNKWDDAIKLLEELAQAEGSGVNRPLVLLTLGSIYQAKLGNPEKADEVYQRLMQEFPEHPLGKVAKAQHEQLSGKAGATPARAPSLP
jgi:tetratricopeptide (TPR) repeat protein